MAKAKNKATSLWKDFKAFVSRGNVLDMATGVVIGGAFNAIVTALVNILLSVCTWGVPGGLTGLITVLPALTASQAGMNPGLGLDQSFHKDDLQALAEALANDTYAGQEITPSVIETVKASITGNYTLYGSEYAYNQAAVINWGAFINAIISFIIIALTLFVIVKVVAYLTNKSKQLEAKLQEQYYLAHPEERPVPPAPGAPVLTEVDLLVQIRDELKKNSVAPTATTSETAAETSSETTEEAK